jgi:Ca2+-binding RTX toxin-like protein
MIGRVGRGGLLLAAALLIAPGSAVAATVAADNPAFTTFQAEPGETNQVTGSVIDGGHYRFADAGAPISPGPGCTSNSANEAACEIREGGISVSLGDGNDTADFSTNFAGMILEGGDGDDTLTATTGPDNVYGGDGVDVIRTLSGNDSISGVPGDAIFSGPGKDFIDTGNLGRARGPESRIDCGSGPDRVWSVRDDLLQRNCEEWVSDDIVVKTHGVLTRRALVYRGRCNTGDSGRDVDCTGRLELQREDGVRVGTARFSGHNRRAFSIVFRVGAGTRRAIRTGLILAVGGDQPEDVFGFKMIQRA